MKLRRPAVSVALVAILLASATILFHRLGAGDICSGNEAVEAVFVQQMVEHDHYIFPLENGRQPMYKPPLFHWSATALDRIAGIRRVTATNLRTVSAIYALAGIAITIALAGWLLGAEGAIFAGLTLAASYQYISQGRFARVDMTLCFFEAASLFAFVWWLPPVHAQSSSIDAVDTPSRRWRLYVFAVAMGLGVLAKGPVGALLPGAAIVVFLLVSRRWSDLLAILEPGAVILGAVIASSWYLACYFGGRFGFLNRQLASENVGRFFGSLGTMAPWYYLEPILLNSLPLSLLVPVAVVVALWPRRAATNADGESPKASSAARLFAIFWVVTVVFFSIAAYKRRAYLLPLWPPSAFLLAWLILRLREYSVGGAIKWAFAAICCALVVFNFVYLPQREIRECASDSFRPAAEEITRAVSPDDPLYTFGFDEELAPLLFYLDRDAPPIKGRLGDAPPGYIIVPERVWRMHRDEALDLDPVLTSEHGTRRLILLRRGKTYARLAYPARSR